MSKSPCVISSFRFFLNLFTFTNTLKAFLVLYARRAYWYLHFLAACKRFPMWFTKAIIFQNTSDELIKEDPKEIDVVVLSDDSCDVQPNLQSSIFPSKVNTALPADSQTVQTTSSNKTVSQQPTQQRHPKKKRFECDICKQSFRSTGYFFLHKDTHTTVKPFGCGICGECFGSSEVLDIHMVMHDDSEVLWWKITL